MVEIIVFRSNEIPKLNYPEIETLLAALGKEQGLRVFERVVFEIADKLCQLELAIYEGDLKTAERRARTLHTLCPQVGLETLAHIANDMVGAILQGNTHALPAICRRMVCMGEASLFKLAECHGCWQTSSGFGLKHGGIRVGLLEKAGDPECVRNLQAKPKKLPR